MHRPAVVIIPCRWKGADIMPWKTLLDSLYDYIKLHSAADYVKKGLPEDVSIVKNNETLVGIARGTEQWHSAYDGGDGEVTLYLNFCTRNDSPDMDDSYDALDALEKDVVDVIRAWAEQDTPAGETIDVMQVQLKNGGGDPYLQRPHVGSYLDVVIDWSRREM